MPVAEHDEDQHRSRHALVHVLEEDVEGHGQKDEEGPIQQVSDDAQPDEPGVRNDVLFGRGLSRRRRRTSSDLDESFENPLKIPTPSR